MTARSPSGFYYGVLLLKAVALALREMPELNGFWIDGRAIKSESVHVGVAVSLRGGGLVAPALRDTDKRSIDELMRNFQDLVTRARAGSLRSSEMTDATVTVTSLGERGVESVFGIIYPPRARARRFWQDRGAPLGCRREDRRAARDQRDGLRGPPGDRWPSRRAIPRHGRPPTAEPGEAMTKDAIRVKVLEVLASVVPTRARRVESRYRLARSARY